MEIAALESWKLMTLMGAGALFSLAGLSLIFKSKTDGHSMVLHVAGMKFEASSAGVLVFLIGTAFFATPLFVPERSHDTQARGAASNTRSPEDLASGSTGLTSTRPAEISRAASSEDGLSLLSANEIRELLSGNTLTGTWDDWTYRQYFGMDRTTFWIDEEGKRTDGTWNVDPALDLYRSAWPDGSRNAYPIGRIGGRYYVIDGAELRPFRILQGKQIDDVKDGISLLSANEIDALLSGNTINGSWDDWSYQQYHAPDGFTVRILDNGERSTGKWWADEQLQVYRSSYSERETHFLPIGEDEDGYFKLDGTTRQHFVVVEGRRIQ